MHPETECESLELVSGSEMLSRSKVANQICRVFFPHVQWERLHFHLSEPFPGKQYRFVSYWVSRKHQQPWISLVAKCSRQIQWKGQGKGPWAPDFDELHHMSFKSPYLTFLLRKFSVLFTMGYLVHPCCFRLQQTHSISLWLVLWLWLFCSQQSCNHVFSATAFSPTHPYSP